MTDTAAIRLVLYVAGQTPKSLAAISNLERICAEHLDGKYVVEVIDLKEHPASRASTASSPSRPWSGNCPCRSARSSATFPTPPGAGEPERRRGALMARGLPAETPQSMDELLRRLEEAEETIRAIREGEIDALVVRPSHDEEIFTLQGGTDSYRAFMETMGHGAAALGAHGEILYANSILRTLIDKPLIELQGRPLSEQFPAQTAAQLRDLLSDASRSKLRRGLLRDHAARFWGAFLARPGTSSRPPSRCRPESSAAGR